MSSSLILSNAYIVSGGTVPAFIFSNKKGLLKLSKLILTQLINDKSLNQQHLCGVPVFLENMRKGQIDNVWARNRKL